MIAPKWGQNIDGSFNVELSKDSFRGSAKYQRGSNLITLDSALKIARPQGNKINVDVFAELKAPKTWLQQSKIAFIASYDIESIHIFDVSNLIDSGYAACLILDISLYRSARRCRLSTKIPRPSLANPASRLPATPPT